MGQPAPPPPSPNLQTRAKPIKHILGGGSRDDGGGTLEQSQGGKQLHNETENNPYGVMKLKVH